MADQVGNEQSPEGTAASPDLIAVAPYEVGSPGPQSGTSPGSGLELENCLNSVTN
jgi:hypothetical protein